MGYPADRCVLGKCIIRMWLLFERERGTVVVTRTPRTGTEIVKNEF